LVIVNFFCRDTQLNRRNNQRVEGSKHLTQKNLSQIHVNQIRLLPDTPYTQIKGRKKVCERRGEKDKPCDSLERAGSERNAKR
jgi:hypothetical protein